VQDRTEPGEQLLNAFAKFDGAEHKRQQQRLERREAQRLSHDTCNRHGSAIARRAHCGGEDAERGEHHVCAELIDQNAYAKKTHAIKRLDHRQSEKRGVGE
jgi:hypothetical protein